jgi:hypothetical protein
MIFIVIINFIFYYFAVIFDKYYYKISASSFFVFTALILRLVVKNQYLPDYDAYYSVIGTINPDFSFKTIFTEPYYFQLVNLLNLKFTAEKSINFFYTFNFIVTTIFYTWLIFIKEISPWKKILLFSLYFHVFSFILLRNTISYILIAYLFYLLSFNKTSKIAYLSFLSHLTSLPALISSLFKNKRGDKKLIFFMLLFIIVFSQLIKLELFNIYQKFSSYQDSQDYGVSLFHKFYFYFFTLINIFLYFYKKSMVFNYTYMPIFVLYLILQNANAVMGYRFSVYLVLYLLFYTNDNKSKNTSDFKIKLFSFVYIVFIFFNFQSIFP